MDNRKISLACITYQEFKKTIESFSKVINDSRIGEIVVCDDCSEELIQWKLEDWLQFDAPDKIKLCNNLWHIGEHLNKRMAVLMADEEYVLLMEAGKDIVYTEDIAIIFGYEWNENILLQLPFGEFFNRAEYIRTFDEHGDKMKVVK